MSSIPQRSRVGALSLSVLLTAALAACGGGGGGGRHGGDPIVVPEGVRVEPASSNSNVTPGNFDSLAGPLVSLVGSAGGSPAAGTLSEKASQAGASAKKPRGAAGGAASVAHLLRTVVQTLYKNPPATAAAASAGKSQALALASVSHLCLNSGGSWRTITDDSDNDGFPSPGDRISVEFDACQVDALALPTDGGFTFVIDDVEFDRGDNIVGLVVEGRYDDLTVGSAASLDGAFTAWQTLDNDGVETYRFSYDNVRATTPDAGNAIYNVDIEGEISATQNRYAIDGAMTLGSQTYSVVQSTEWFVARNSSIPRQGTIYLQDAFGDSLSLQASSSERLDFGFIPAGTNQPTFVLLDQTWSDFGI